MAKMAGFSLRCVIKMVNNVLLGICLCLLCPNSITPCRYAMLMNSSNAFPMLKNLEICAAFLLSCE